jgi:hypothetical protein
MHKECFGCSGIGFVAFKDLFFVFLTPLTIFSAPNVQIRDVEVLSRHPKQQSPPLGSGLP